jgi:hypothetical protein
VDLTSELENTLGGCGFAGINVGEDPDISVFGEVFHLPFRFGMEPNFRSVLLFKAA